MDRLLACSATIALFALWAGVANAGTPDAATLTGPAATKAQPSDQPGDNDPDMAALVKNLPSNMDGEIRRAQLLRANGSFPEAAKVLSQLMIVAPDDPRIVGEFGKVMTQEGRSQDALAFLKRAIELQPNDWTLYSGLGVAYDQLDDHVRARLAYQHALALKPNEASILNNYAVSRMLAGDLNGAQRLLAQASASGGGDPKIANNVAMLASMRPAGAAPAPAMAVASATQAGAPRTLPGVVSPTMTVSGPVLSAPRPAGAQVVMQKVPVDPLAGPVAVKHPQPTKLAKAMPHGKTPKATALPAKNAPVAPVLRTAAQVN